MKKKIVCALIISAFLVLFACAFTIDPNSSIKNLTKPYANTYECTRATLGDTDLLEDYEYMRIIIHDNGKLNVEMQRKGGKKRIYQCQYTYDDNTCNLSAEIGILGFTYRQTTKIENGKFVISMPVLTKQLTMLFEVI